jgi:hypothetical protein
MASISLSASRRFNKSDLSLLITSCSNNTSYRTLPSVLPISPKMTVKRIRFRVKLAAIERYARCSRLLTELKNQKTTLFFINPRKCRNNTPALFFQSSKNTKSTKLLWQNSSSLKIWKYLGHLHPGTSRLTKKTKILTQSKRKRS